MPLTKHEWRMIDTAPPETLLLMFCPDEDCIGIGIGELIPDDEGVIDLCWFWENGIRCEPSHWMPLPEKPTSESA